MLEIAVGSVGIGGVECVIYFYTVLSRQRLAFFNKNVSFESYIDKDYF
jgi:hypothetical protein